MGALISEKLKVLESAPIGEVFYEYDRLLRRVRRRTLGARHSGNWPPRNEEIKKRTFKAIILLHLEDIGVINAEEHEKQRKLLGLH